MKRGKFIVSYYKSISMEDKVNVFIVGCICGAVLCAFLIWLFAVVWAPVSMEGDTHWDAPPNTTPEKPEYNIPVVHGFAGHTSKKGGGKPKEPPPDTPARQGIVKKK